MRYLSRISFFFLIPLFFIGAGEKDIQLTEGIQPGNLAPEINMQDIDLMNDGYVLVQFWAAYDPQSRVMNTQMHNVISQSEANVRLVSISLDKNMAVFRGVIKADHLNASTQFIEPRGENSEIFRKYRLQSGFGNWLIDSNGMIVAKNVSPSEIQNFILM